MTHEELMTERRHIYETRLGMLGYGPGAIPTAADHNLAVEEADAHIHALMDEKQQRTKELFDDLRKTCD